MGVPSASAGTNCDCGNALTDRDVRVRRRAVHVRPDPQMGIDGSNGGQDRRIVGQLTGRSRADLLDLCAYAGAGRPLVFGIERAVDLNVLRGGVNALNALPGG